MTASSNQNHIQLHTTDDEVVEISQIDFLELLRTKKNFKVYQLSQKVRCPVLILERVNGIEKRFNAIFGTLIYEFHLGKKNSILRGDVYSPDGTMYSPVSMYKENELEQLRYGRVFRCIRIEYV